MTNRVEGTNKPAGFIMETAFLPIFGNMPQPSERELLDTLDEAQQIYASAGVTTCSEGATHAKDLAFLRKGAAEGLLYLDVVSLPLILEIPALIKEYAPSFQGGPMELPKEAPNAFGFYKSHLKLGGIKFALDGSPQGKNKYVGDTVLRQFSQADLIVLNKTDLVSAGALSSLRAWLAELAGR